MSPDWVIFVDSSVLFAAALSPTGFARDLILLSLEGKLKLVASEFVLTKTERNLRKKAAEALEFLGTFRNQNILTILEPPPDLVREIAQRMDTKDAAIVAGAIGGHATHLVTYDRRHILSQAEILFVTYELIVCTPEQLISSTRS